MKRKLIIFIVFILATGLFAAFDIARAQSFHMEIKSITPEVIEADGKTEVLVTVILTRNGKPVEGHHLYAVPTGGGTLRSNRETSDKNGKTVFTYFPYRSTAIMPAGDVTLNIIDESNSIFIEINAKADVTLKLVEPAASEDAGGDIDWSSVWGK